MSGELPNGWEQGSLSELVTAGGLFSDGDWIESKDQDPEGENRLLQLADIGDGIFVDKSSRFVNNEKFKSLNCTELHEGDVLIARMPDPLGRACLMPLIGQRCLTVVDVAVFRSGSIDVSHNLLMHFINSPQVRKIIEVESSGTTRKRIARGKLAELKLPIPPAAEQNRIAQKLDELLAQVDTLKARIDAIPALLKRFRQSALAAAVSGRLTEEWRAQHVGWVDEGSPTAASNHEIERWASQAQPNLRAVPINQVSADEKYSLAIGPFGSNLKVSDYRTEGRPLVFVREIRAERFGDEKTKFITPEKFAELKAHQIAAGDILITKMGDPPGDVAIYPDNAPDAVITADCIKLRVNESIILRKYAYLQMKSDSFRQKILGISAGVAQQKVSLGNFREIPLLVPSLKEQTEIVRRVEQLFAFADQLEAKVASAKSRIDHLTQSILAKAFRGELVPQDPNDEPANVLLESIQAQRAATPKTKQGRKST